MYGALMATPKFCPECGVAVGTGKFCPECGSGLVPDGGGAKASQPGESTGADNPVSEQKADQGGAQSLRGADEKESSITQAMEGSRTRRRWIAAGIGGAVLLIVVAVIAATSGGGDGGGPDIAQLGRCTRAFNTAPADATSGFMRDLTAQTPAGSEGLSSANLGEVSKLLSDVQIDVFFGGPNSRNNCTVTLKFLSHGNPAYAAAAEGGTTETGLCPPTDDATLKLLAYDTWVFTQFEFPPDWSPSKQKADEAKGYEATFVQLPDGLPYHEDSCGFMNELARYHFWPATEMDQAMRADIEAPFFKNQELVFDPSPSRKDLLGDMAISIAKRSQ